MPGIGLQNNGLFHRLTVSAEGYPSGQRGQTVNLLAHAFGGSNPPPSTINSQAAKRLPGAGVVQW